MKHICTLMFLMSFFVSNPLLASQYSEAAKEAINRHFVISLAEQNEALRSQNQDLKRANTLLAKQINEPSAHEQTLKKKIDSLQAELLKMIDLLEEKDQELDKLKKQQSQAL